MTPVHTVGKNLYLGLKSASLGFFNLRSGSLTVNGSTRVGIEGFGQFNQTDGTVKIKGNDRDPLPNGFQLSDSGDFLNLRKVSAGTPSLECTTSRNPGLIVGLQSNGYYNLTDGTLNVNYSEIIGLEAGGSGIFNQENGTHSISGNLYLGRKQGSYGSFSLSVPPDPDNPEAPIAPEVGLLDVHGYASVAYEGDGDFLQTGGTVKIRGIDREIVNQNIRGRLALSKANPVQSLNCSQQKYVGFTIGRGGRGSYGLENGELLVSHGEVIGLFPGSDGYFRHTSGRHFVGETLTIARDPESVGQYDFYAGQLTAWGGIVNNGTFNFYGGTLQGKFSNNSLFNANIKNNQKVLSDFYNKANVHVAAVKTNIKFEKNFYNDGVFDSYEGSSTTIKHLTVNPTGTLKVGAAIDEMIITGNFINKSANKTGWKTEYGSLIFSGAGTHIFKTGSDNSGSFDDNFAWGSLMVPGAGVLRLQGHLYAEAIKGVKADPATKKITNMTGFCGIGIYYDPALSQSDLAGLRLFNPWGRQVGLFTDTGFVSSCK